MSTENAMQNEDPAVVGVSLNGLLDADLVALIEQWKHRARVAGRDCDLEEEDIGKAYLRAKFWAYLTCAIELAKAIGKPIPIPDQPLTDQQISAALAIRQRPSKLPCL